MDITTRYARWRRYHQTQRLLESLDDRTLKDVGLHRRPRSASCSQAMLRTLGLR